MLSIKKYVLKLENLLAVPVDTEDLQETIGPKKDANAPKIGL